MHWDFKGPAAGGLPFLSTARPRAPSAGWPWPHSVTLHLCFDQASSSVAELVAACVTPTARPWAPLTGRPRPLTLDTVLTAARITATPGPAHQEAFKRISRCLSSTLDPQLAYSEATHALKGYADTDSSVAAHDHTISGHTPLIDHGNVPWASKCQETVAPFSFPATSSPPPSCMITSTTDPPHLLPTPMTRWPMPSRRHCCLHSQALCHKSRTVCSVRGASEMGQSDHRLMQHVDIDSKYIKCLNPLPHH
jgi:hypothetical protein